MWWFRGIRELMYCRALFENLKCSFLANQETPYILWNLIAHNCVHCSVQLVPVQRQMPCPFDHHNNIGWGTHPVYQTYMKSYWITRHCEIKLKRKVCHVPQSVRRLPMGWTVQGSNPGEGEIFHTCPDQPWGPPSLLYNGYRDLPRGQDGRGVTLTPHPLLVPRSKIE